MDVDEDSAGVRVDVGGLREAGQNERDDGTVSRSRQQQQQSCSTNKTRIPQAPEHEKPQIPTFPQVRAVYVQASFSQFLEELHQGVWEFTLPPRGLRGWLQPEEDVAADENAWVATALSQSLKRVLSRITFPELIRGAREFYEGESAPVTRYFGDRRRSHEVYSMSRGGWSLGKPMEIEYILREVAFDLETVGAPPWVLDFEEIDVKTVGEQEHSAPPIREQQLSEASSSTSLTRVALECSEDEEHLRERFLHTMDEQEGATDPEETMGVDGIRTVQGGIPLSSSACIDVQDRTTSGEELARALGPLASIRPRSEGLPPLRAVFHHFLEDPDRKSAIQIQDRSLSQAATRNTIEAKTTTMTGAKTRTFTGAKTRTVLEPTAKTRGEIRMRALRRMTAEHQEHNSLWKTLIPFGTESEDIVVLRRQGFSGPSSALDAELEAQLLAIRARETVTRESGAVLEGLEGRSSKPKTHDDGETGQAIEAAAAATNGGGENQTAQERAENELLRSLTPMQASEQWTRNSGRRVLVAVPLLPGGFPSESGSQSVAKVRTLELCNAADAGLEPTAIRIEFDWDYDDGKLHDPQHRRGPQSLRVSLLLVYKAAATKDAKDSTARNEQEEGEQAEDVFNGRKSSTSSPAQAAASSSRKSSISSPAHQAAALSSRSALSNIQQQQQERDDVEMSSAACGLSPGTASSVWDTASSSCHAGLTPSSSPNVGGNSTSSGASSTGASSSRFLSFPPAAGANNRVSSRLSNSRTTGGTSFSDRKKGPILWMLSVENKRASGALVLRRAQGDHHIILVQYKRRLTVDGTTQQVQRCVFV
ncbi:unnamed protein product [Amoebophrya sp. A25]|nr:unnamed protein product [Amoebophrya sp. A25]|eukprot:GSA25T00025009001.1